MSNALAIAAVTAVLKDKLNDGMVNAQLGGLGNVTVSALPLDRLGEKSDSINQLNLFLWRVTPNTGWVNERLPARSPSGARVDSPLLSLDLHYVLTAHGVEDLTAEILLGYGMQVLHETPVLGREAIRTSLGGGAVTGIKLPDAYEDLAAAALADQFEQIKITPHYIDMEDVSRVWSAFNTGLRPSCHYQVSVVLIESAQPVARGLPVRQANLRALPFQKPRISRVMARPSPADPPDPSLPITPGASLVIEGGGLGGPDPVVRFGETDVLPVTATHDRIEAVVPVTQQPGIVALRVASRYQASSPTDLRPFEVSDVKPIAVAPDFAITGGDPDVGFADGQVTAKFAHPVGADQRAILLLNELSPPPGQPPRAYSFRAQPRVPPPDETSVLVFKATDVAAATYLFRVDIDGVSTALEFGASGYDGPSLAIAP